MSSEVTRREARKGNTCPEETYLKSTLFKNQLAAKAGTHRQS